MGMGREGDRGKKENFKKKNEGRLPSDRINSPWEEKKDIKEYFKTALQ